MSDKKLTILDIARLAGVSRTTVSRVLNHRPEVDRAVRERVMQVIKEQGFVPNMAASGLKRGRNLLIGMLVPSFTWPDLPDLMRGVAEAINKTPYELVLYSYNDEDQSRDRTEVINRILATQLTSGILATYPGRASEQIARLAQQGHPVVVIDDQQEHQLPWVGIDNVGAAQLAVRHLVELGHRRIAHIKGPEEFLVTQQRAEGYRLALASAGIPYNPNLVLPGDFLAACGREGMLHLLALPPEERPTAIFTASDQTAYGVVSAAAEQGVRIPEEIALVSFDDESFSAFLHPTLTTIHQPSYEMGQRGVDLLLSLIAAAEAEQSGLADAKGDEPPPRIILPTRLIVRTSCGAHLHAATPSLVEQQTL
jgi:LacI family transcriptional regulator